MDPATVELDSGAPQVDPGTTQVDLGAAQVDPVQVDPGDARSGSCNCSSGPSSGKGGPYLSGTPSGLQYCNLELLRWTLKLFKWTLELLKWALQLFKWTLEVQSEPCSCSSGVHSCNAKDSGERCSLKDPPELEEQLSR